MINNTTHMKIRGIIGECGNLEVFLGFAASNILYEYSFVDILNEETGFGYQRHRNISHSKSFKQYILTSGTSTIPLTFNLRAEHNDLWEINRLDDFNANLIIKNNSKPLAQVDCQHRLGELGDVAVPLAFMTYIGLSLREEMALFNIINSKSKGLSSSLTDYHESNLLTDLATDAPHLYIAKKLNENPKSPWYRLVRYGGETNSGLKRKTSLRMMQKSIERLIKSIRTDLSLDTEDLYTIIETYWVSIKKIFNNEWDDHRHHLLTKGVGLYSLMMLLGDIVNNQDPIILSEQNFYKILKPLKDKISWRSDGMFADAGGHKGATEVYTVLKRTIL